MSVLRSALEPMAIPGTSLACYIAIPHHNPGRRPRPSEEKNTAQENAWPKWETLLHLHKTHKSLTRMNEQVLHSLVDSRWWTWCHLNANAKEKRSANTGIKKFGCDSYSVEDMPIIQGDRTCSPVNMVESAYNESKAKLCNIGQYWYCWHSTRSFLNTKSVLLSVAQVVQNFAQSEVWAGRRHGWTGFCSYCMVTFAAWESERPHRSKVAF